MKQKRNSMLKSSIGSVFTIFSEQELEEYNKKDGYYVAISGAVKEPSIQEIKKDSTIRDVLESAGGLLEGKKLKAIQVGIPCGRLYIEEDLDKPIDFKIFKGGVCKAVIVLSEDECIIQYAKYYLQYLIGKMEREQIARYLWAKDEFYAMLKILDQIAKGRATMRDVFLLRGLSEDSKRKAAQEYSTIGQIIEHFYEEMKEHVEEKHCPTLRCNHLTKLTITEKCIGCGACKRACPVDCVEGEVKKRHKIDYLKCTHCGACSSACPIGAITTGNNIMKFLRDLATPQMTVITQMAPAVRVAIGEAFGFEPGENVEKRVAAALRRLGVDYVFDTTWAADLTIMEEANELIERLEGYEAGDPNVKLPLLTSCCPAWVKFIEHNYGDMLDIPSTTKSPMQMFATIAKDLWGKEKGIPRDRIISVAIMPCLAKKFEASRREFSKGLNYDVDYVITTNDLIDIFKDTGIDLKEMEEEEIDQIMGEYTGGGIIFGRTGGVIEAATRVAVEKITGKRLDEIEFKSLQGWDSFRSCDVEVGDVKLKIGVTYGLKEAKKMLDKIRSGEEFYHAIEIMACTGGCIGGGGQPKAKKREVTLQQRMEGLNEIDRALPIRRSSENQAVQYIYEKYLDYPLSDKAHELLHTEYFIRRKY
ncbi:[FeFe] hydrogenase, group A [[Clostridium] polysaccharolyticum]|uniref:[FeFe] hydrogenase, group A n=1 Tax=[Clostridium] polysaccharolyticum TaxID=29364 RepID=A0A1I0DDP6_9FIRM|nr:[FeFe] hydrogenase, group A [[Clostridium] polysaccharolyticum]SET30135.1 [FeFe] hydrogenase, group A [[Clostridium] polysaccharolyticum]